MIDVDAIATDLKSSGISDRAHRLKPGGRKQIEDEIARHQNAHVVVLEGDDAPADAKLLWDKLGYDEKRDLLFITNGKAWEVRGWGLTHAQIDDAMQKGASGFKAYLGKGIEMSLLALDVEKAPPRDAEKAAPPAAGGSGSSTPWLGLGIGGGVAIGLVAFAIHRRNKRAGESRGEFDKARGSAERAYTDLILACEELGGDAGSQLQLKAADLKKRLDDVVADADGKPDRMSDRVVLGKISQLEGELAALRSTQLQKARG